MYTKRSPYTTNITHVYPANSRYSPQLRRKVYDEVRAVDTECGHGGSVHHTHAKVGKTLKCTECVLDQLFAALNS